MLWLDIFVLLGSYALLAVYLVISHRLVVENMN